MSESIQEFNQIGVAMAGTGFMEWAHAGWTQGAAIE